MKWIKDFRLFESKEWDMEMIKERLIDLDHLGLKTSISKPSSIIIDFEKKIRENRDSPFQLSKVAFIKSQEVTKYDGGISSNSLTIDAKSPEPVVINLNELEAVHQGLCDFLGDAYGLKPNYIYVLSAESIKYIYFRNFSDVKEFIMTVNPTNPHVIETDGITFGFY